MHYPALPWHGTRECRLASSPRRLPWKGTLQSVAQRLTIVLSTTLTLLIAAALIPISSAQAQPVADFRVMTWNVKTELFGPHDWAKVIKDLRPDILGLQEICASEGPQLISALKGYGLTYFAAAGPVRQGPVRGGYYKGCERVNLPNLPNLPDLPGRLPDLPDLPNLPAIGGGPYGQVILSRFPIHDTKTVLYPRTGVGFPGSGRLLGDEQRGYMAATVDLPNGKSARVFNTHITVSGRSQDSDADKAVRVGWQTQQLKILSDAASAQPMSFVMGDFNVQPGSSALKSLSSAQGFVEVDPSNMATSHNVASKPNSPADAKNDYIYMRGFRTVRPAETYWVPSSDHRPLLANVVLSTTQPGSGQGDSHTR